MGNNDFLDIVQAKLTEIRDALVKINQTTGATQRANEMKEEIQKIGWKGILNKYHPDINVDEPAAHELFKMYRFVYNQMKKDDISTKKDN